LMGFILKLDLKDCIFDVFLTLLFNYNIIIKLCKAIYFLVFVIDFFKYNK
jgi:hypothetical protein